MSSTTGVAIAAAAALVSIAAVTGTWTVRAQGRRPTAPTRPAAPVRPVGKEYSRAEVERLLATAPERAFSCPVGEPWWIFQTEAPHGPGTVAILRELFDSERSPWKRFHLLSALSYETGPSLRGFWLDL